MTLEQMEKIFAQECCLFGDKNGIPAIKAAQYIPRAAILKAMEDCIPHVDWDIFSFGEKCTAVCLYLSGWKYATTVANVMELTGKKPEFKETNTKGTPKEKLIEFKPVKNTK